MSQGEKNQRAERDGKRVDRRVRRSRRAIIEAFDRLIMDEPIDQISVSLIAREADVMIVIGGRISANTTRLAEISAAHCPLTHHVEGADELCREWFEGAGVIGITAGASTPASQIEAVRAEIERLVG